MGKKGGTFENKIKIQQQKEKFLNKKYWVNTQMLCPARY